MGLVFVVECYDFLDASHDYLSARDDQHALTKEADEAYRNYQKYRSMRPDWLYSKREIARETEKALDKYHDANHRRYDEFSAAAIASETKRQSSSAAAYSGFGFVLLLIWGVLIKRAEKREARKREEAARERR